MRQIMVTQMLDDFDQKNDPGYSAIGRLKGLCRNPRRWEAALIFVKTMTEKEKMLSGEMVPSWKIQNWVNEPVCKLEKSQALNDSDQGVDYRVDLVKN